MTLFFFRNKGGGVWGFESLTFKIYIHIPMVCLRLPYRSILRFFSSNNEFLLQELFFIDPNLGIWCWILFRNHNHFLNSIQMNTTKIRIMTKKVWKLMFLCHNEITQKSTHCCARLSCITWLTYITCITRITCIREGLKKCLFSWLLPSSVRPLLPL